MTSHWPLDDLTLSGPQIMLRPVRDADIAPLVNVFPDDFELDPSLPPLPGLPPPADRRRRFVQSFWRHRGCWSIGDWALDFGVWREGEPIGIQTLEGTEFTRERTVDTASWIARPFRGEGFGIRARELALSFAFVQLAAEKAITSAVVANHASLGVSRHLGYRDDGVRPYESGTEVVDLQHLVMSRHDWLAQHRTPTSVNGFDPCRPFFGLS